MRTIERETDCRNNTTCPGQDILRCEWLAPEEVLTIPDFDMLWPRKRRAIIEDMLSGRTFSVEAIRELEPEEWEKVTGDKDAGRH